MPPKTVGKVLLSIELFFVCYPFSLPVISIESFLTFWFGLWSYLLSSICLSLCICISLSLAIYLSISIYLSICLSINLPIHLYISIHQSVHTLTHSLTLSTSLSTPLPSGLFFVVGFSPLPPSLFLFTPGPSRRTKEFHHYSSLIFFFLSRFPLFRNKTYTKSMV